MQLRKFVLGVALAAGVIGLAASPVGATTFPIAPGPNVVPLTTGPFPSGNQYIYQTFLAGSAVLNEQFDFFNVPTVPLGTITTSVALNSNPPAQGPFGIANLTLTWFSNLQGPLGTLQITNNLGVVIDAAASLVVNLLVTAPLDVYHLLVTGTALNNGGFYNLLIQTPAGRNQAETPLPPALILFGSALIGLTALGRRRRKRSELGL